MLDVNYAANSGVKIDQATDLLDGPALLNILNKMSDSKLAELEDELNFAHFTGIFGPILSDITGDAKESGRVSIEKAPSCAA